MVRYSIQVYLFSTDSSISEWDHFGADAPCPYHFLKDEIRAHYEEADSFNRTQDFWKELRGILTRLANNQSGLTYLTGLIAKPQSGQIQARVFFLSAKSNQKR
jgi:hypothetical protein